MLEQRVMELQKLADQETMLRERQEFQLHVETKSKDRLQHELDSSQQKLLEYQTQVNRLEQ